MPCWSYFEFGLIYIAYPMKWNIRKSDEFFMFSLDYLALNWSIFLISCSCMQKNYLKYVTECNVAWKLMEIAVSTYPLQYRYRPYFTDPTSSPPHEILYWLFSTLSAEGPTSIKWTKTPPQDSKQTQKIPKTKLSLRLCVSLCIDSLQR